jgi:hypothetical protein
MLLNFKWLRVPVSNATKDVEAVQLWEVRWTSRHGEWQGSTKPELECFTSLEEAEAFAEALRNAFALIRHTSGNTITLKKAA